jgi:hypothetical protein
MAFAVTRCSIVVSLFALRIRVGRESLKYLTFPQKTGLRAEETVGLLYSTPRELSRIMVRGE